MGSKSNTNSPTADTDESKGAFRKPTNDAASRKYRRHSSASRSPSPDGSPLKGDRRRNHSTRDDRVSGRGDHDADSDSRRYSSKHSQGYSRNSDHTRSGKYVEEEDRNYSRLSSRPGRESRGGAYLDYKERGGDFNRSRDYYHKDKYNRDRPDNAEHASRDKYDERDRRGKDRDYRDEKRDYRRSSRDYRSESYRQKEDDKNDSKAEDRSKQLNEESKKQDERDCKESREKFQDDAPANKNEETAVKRPKLFSFDSSNPTTGSIQGQDLLRKDTPGQAVANVPEPTGNLDAATVAAMRAAELVNKNLIGTGVMTADQKKKLLWGSKKNVTSTEESSHRWDAAIFPDRERQEKFNKLMGVKGEPKLAQNPNSEEKQKELQLDLEKQYTAGLRRRDGRTVGLGL